MTDAVLFCRDRYPHHPIALSAQLYLLRFYESLGFVKSGEPYDDYGIRHVDMRRPA